MLTELKKKCGRWNDGTYHLYHHAKFGGNWTTQVGVRRWRLIFFTFFFSSQLAGWQRLWWSGISLITDECSLRCACVCLCVPRSRRTLVSRQNMDDDKISQLEEELRKAKSVAVEAERNYEEVWCFFCVFLLYFSFHFDCWWNKHLMHAQCFKLTCDFYVHLCVLLQLIIIIVIIITIIRVFVIVTIVDTININIISNDNNNIHISKENWWPLSVSECDDI